MSGVKPTPTKLSGLFDSSSSESSRKTSPKPRLQPLSSPMKTPLRGDVYLSPSIPNSPMVKMAKKGGSALLKLMSKTFFLSLFTIFLVITILLSIDNYNKYKEFNKTFNEQCKKSELLEFCSTAKPYINLNISNAKAQMNNKVNDKNEKIEFDAMEVIRCCENYAVHHDYLFYKLSARTEFIVAAAFTILNFIFVSFSIYAKLHY